LNDDVVSKLLLSTSVVSLTFAFLSLIIKITISLTSFNHSLQYNYFFTTLPSSDKLRKIET